MVSRIFLFCLTTFQPDINGPLGIQTNTRSWIFNHEIIPTTKVPSFADLKQFSVIGEVNVPSTCKQPPGCVSLDRARYKLYVSKGVTNDNITTTTTTTTRQFLNSQIVYFRRKGYTKEKKIATSVLIKSVHDDQ